MMQDKAAEVRFNAAEATVRPLLQSYGPWIEADAIRFIILPM